MLYSHSLIIPAIVLLLIYIMLILKNKNLCFAAVSGLGFGFMSGAFSVVNILADSVGPGTVGIHGDSQYYFLSSGSGDFNTMNSYCRGTACKSLYPFSSLYDHGHHPAPHVLGGRLL